LKNFKVNPTKAKAQNIEEKKETNIESRLKKIYNYKKQKVKP